MIKIGLRLVARPVDGDTADVSATSPINPLTEVTVTIEVPGTPTRRITEAGLAVRAKSVTVRVTEAPWTSEPLVAATTTV
jgi:hypothetical protein